MNSCPPCGDMRGKWVIGSMQVPWSDVPEVKIVAITSTREDVSHLLCYDGRTESGTDEGSATAICARIKLGSGTDEASATAICARIWPSQVVGGHMGHRLCRPWNGKPT